MWFVIGLIVGFLIGYLMVIFERIKKPSGTFIIDTRDSAKDICKLEMDENLNSLYYKKSMKLRIVVIEDESLN